MAALAKNIRALGNHTNVGIVGARFLLEVLVQHGHEVLAFALATQTSCPSWGYMVEGAGKPFKSHETPGTLWETWPDLHATGVSKNHPVRITLMLPLMMLLVLLLVLLRLLVLTSLLKMFGASVGLFMYTLAGLDGDNADGDNADGDNADGALLLRPLPVAVRQLGFASVSSTIRGGVKLSWSSNAQRFTAEVSLRVGVAAKLHVLLPVAKSGERIVVTEGVEGRVVWSSDVGATLHATGAVAGVLGAALTDDGSELVLELLGGSFFFLAARRGSGENLLLDSGAA